MGNSTVSAIVVNWNGGSMAAACANSLALQTLTPKLYIVDNASVDGSLEQMVDAFPSATIIRNSYNRGYAAANNQVLNQAAESDYVLLLNNDALFPESEALETVVRYMDSNPEVQGACGRYENPSGEFQHFYNQLPQPIDLATIYGFGRYIPWLLNRKGLQRFLLQNSDFGMRGTIEQPAFACVIARGACIHTLGHMDERFPIFFNDVDYCWRWREQGWTWHYLPTWRVTHLHGASVKRFNYCAPELLSSAVRFARMRFNLIGFALVTVSAISEAVWMRVIHRDMRYRLGHIARGRTFFST